MVFSKVWYQKMSSVKSCSGCPLIRRCGERAATRQEFVEKLDDSIPALAAEEMDHNFRAIELAYAMPKNWLRRFMAGDDISREKINANRAYEKSQIYHEAQQGHIRAISELIHLAAEAPKTCSTPDFRLGRLVCTSELNTFKNRRKL